MRFEPRRIADIHGDVQPPRDDDREFALVERASDFNNTLYDGFVRPWLRQLINEPTAELMRKAHPFHQQQVMWNSLNPALWWLAGSASQVSKDRQPASPANPLLAWQALFSNQIQDALNGYRDLRDAAQEMCFYGVYGVLNSLAGNSPGRDLQAHAEQHDKVLIERLQDALPLGGLMEALIRILFLLGRDSDEPGKQSVEKLILQLQVLLPGLQCRAAGPARNPAPAKTAGRHPPAGKPAQPAPDAARGRRTPTSAGGRRQFAAGTADAAVQTTRSGVSCTRCSMFRCRVSA